MPTDSKLPLSKDRDTLGCVIEDIEELLKNLKGLERGSASTSLADRSALDSVLTMFLELVEEVNPITSEPDFIYIMEWVYSTADLIFLEDMRNEIVGRFKDAIRVGDIVERGDNAQA